MHQGTLFTRGLFVFQHISLSPYPQSIFPPSFLPPSPKKMVIIHMKSTTDKDEFLFNGKTDMEVDTLIEQLTFMNNSRIRLKSMSSALYNLLNEPGYTHLEGKTAEERNLLEQLHEKVTTMLHLDRIGERTFLSQELLTETITAVRDAAVQIFSECKPDDAIDLLWKSRDDADIHEDTRLRAWYFLELIDPMFKERDFYTPETTKLWWAGKEVKKGNPLKSFSGPNEKSKMICKLSSEQKGCPSREPQLQYTKQRELRQHFTEKRDTFKELERSELADHKNVRRDPGDFIAFRGPTSTGTQLFGDGARGAVDENAKAGGEGLIKLKTDVKKICGPGVSKEP